MVACSNLSEIGCPLVSLNRIGQTSKHERKLQVLADLNLAMKRSTGEMNQGALNQLSRPHEVYEYLL